MSTIGYGDVIPVTDIERGYVIMAAVSGGALYAYLVGAICGVLARMDENNQMFYQEIDQLNRFMRHRGLPQALRVKLRDYLHFRWAEQRTNGSSYAEVMQNMSNNLSVQVYAHIHVPVMQQLYVFHGVSSAFLATLCSQFQVELFSPEDIITKCAPARHCSNPSCSRQPQKFDYRGGVQAQHDTGPHACPRARHCYASGTHSAPADSDR